MTDEKTTAYYTVLGSHDFLDDNEAPMLNDDAKNVYAKTVTVSDRTRYFVTIGLHGKLFNPMGMYSEGRREKFLSKIGKTEWNLKEVNPKIFNMYIKFLSTRNIAWLNNAQRELI
jgi:hypothetical protein